MKNRREQLDIINDSQEFGLRIEGSSQGRRGNAPSTRLGPIYELPNAGHATAMLHR